MINTYSTQNINQDDIKAVLDVLNSDFLTQGPAVECFEEAVSNYCSSGFGLAFNSATSALHAAYLTLNLCKTDVLWTVPNSFVATSNAALMCGASIDFVDIDPDTYNISIPKLKKKLEEASKAKKLPKIITIVHFAGLPCNMQKVKELTSVYNIKLVEDASHALGASFKGSKVGDSKYSDLTVFSFHPVKMITSGEGGFVATNSEQHYQKLKLLRSHGVTREVSIAGQPLQSWEYSQIMLGYNYRMSDISAALGLSQMKRLDEFVMHRNKLAGHYRKHLAKMPVGFQNSDTNSFINSYHLFVITLKKSSHQTARAKLFKFMKDNDIGVNVHYQPIHTQPYYKTLGFQSGDYPNSEEYYENCITLPLHTKMDEKDVKKIVDVLSKWLKAN